MAKSIKKTKYCHLAKSLRTTHNQTCVTFSISVQRLIHDFAFRIEYNFIENRNWNEREHLYVYM